MNVINRHIYKAIREYQSKYPILAVTGPRQSGKTTLLKLILGELEADSGEVRRGTKLEVAYFDQMREGLNLEATLEDFISPGSEWIEINGNRKHVKSYLGDFLFSPERTNSPISTLSGGERNRLLLARLFARPANVLVLDEPTNDLDIDTLDLLEQLLQDYAGTVFLVSHDRTFLDNVVTSMIAYEGDGKWQEYEGGYEDYRIQKKRFDEFTQASNASTINKTLGKDGKKGEIKPETKLSVTKSKLSNKEKAELDKLPNQIEQLEKRQLVLSEQLANPEIYKGEAHVIVTLKNELTQVEEQMTRSMKRWEELLEKDSDSS